MTVTYTAAIATASDCVAGDYADVAVLESEIVSYTEDAEGNETPEYAASGPVCMASRLKSVMM